MSARVTPLPQRAQHAVVERLDALVTNRHPVSCSLDEPNAHHLTDDAPLWRELRDAASGRPRLKHSSPVV